MTGSSTDFVASVVAIGTTVFGWMVIGCAVVDWIGVIDLGFSPGENIVFADTPTSKTTATMVVIIQKLDCFCLTGCCFICCDRVFFFFAISLYSTRYKGILPGGRCPSCIFHHSITPILQHSRFFDGPLMGISSTRRPSEIRNNLRA